MFSVECQDCEFLDEEPADDRRPQRDAQQTLENATPAKNKSKAKATYTQCFPQHTRVLHMHVVTDANDIKKKVAPELLSLQLENFLAKRPLVESLGSVMGTLVNMKRASM